MRGLILILAVFAALWACAPKPATPPSDPQLDAWFTELQQVETAQQAAQLEKRIWERWAQSGSPTVDVLFERAQRAEVAGRAELALSFLEQACELAPEFAAAWHMRASIAFKQEDIPTALTAIHETLEREPRHFGALAGLGLIYEGFGRPEAALAAYEAALAEHPYFEPAKQGAQRLRGKASGRTI